ncbi:MAG: transcription termination factor Rho [Planctomycetes bacterium]|nr:transcription termination factor Rho [Planctomycetota bacterium]
MTATRKKRSHGPNKGKFKNKQGYRRKKGKGFQGAKGPLKEVGLRIDYEALPKDLSADEKAELLEALPEVKKGAAPDPVEHDALLGMHLNEMHELAEDLKVDDFQGRNRREAIWEITRHRLQNHVPVQVQGVVDVWDSKHVFLRTQHTDYMPSEEDVFVPHSIAETCSLAKGMTLTGTLRPLGEGEKYFCLDQVNSIDGDEPEESMGRAGFKELIPLYPEQRFTLEGTQENPLEMRIIDLVAPVGRGQRGLIVAPPRTGKTVLLHMLAKSIVANATDCHLIILLVDERPEEVTDFERSVIGDKVEVVSSTFDEPASRHIQVAEMVIEKAKCMVEAGEDVVILLDSITRLARACNTEAPSNGKLLSGGLEATALQFPKRFFGAARNIEHGGSLTILGTALIETGSKMDEVIFEEFKGTGNSEIVLDRRLSDRRIFPAIDINRSGTRKEELLFTEEEIERVWMLRKVLNELDPVEAMEMLIAKMRKTTVNAEFLMTIG